MSNGELAENIGRLRDILSIIAENGPNVSVAAEYRDLRDQLVRNETVNSLLPEFVIECRNPRDFWNYISRAYSSYGARSQYIEAQLLPVERMFRPERAISPGIRPPEVRIEYSPIRPAALGTHEFVSANRIAQLRGITNTIFDLRKLIRLCEEINVAYTEGLLLSTAMLTRTILDHVPPIFGMATFAQVVANYSGGRSFKETMGRLENATTSKFCC